MISLTAEYALRAVVHMVAVANLADEANLANEAPVSTVGQIAASTLIPEGYLSKVLQQLRKAGIIKSQRGTGGGFRLGREPQQISVYDVVQAVDPIRRIEQCPLGLEAHGTSLCPLHKQLDEAAAQLEARFRGVCILEMLESPTALDEAKQKAAQSRRQSVDDGCPFPLGKV